MHRLYSFANTTLPVGRSEYQADTPSAVASMVATAGGGPGFDTLGSGVARLRAPYELRYRAVMTASSLTSLESTVATWRALVGTRGKLRKRLASGATYYDITARLLDLRLDIQPRHSHGKFLPAEWRFLVLDEFWRAALASSTTRALTTNPISFSVTNAGNAIVRDAVITFDPVDTKLTAVAITAFGGTYDIGYTGDISVGDSITIDCGARRVYNKALADQYANFALNAKHVQEDWLGILTGARTLTVSKSGGSANSTVNVTFYSKYY